MVRAKLFWSIFAMALCITGCRRDPAEQPLTLPAGNTADLPRAVTQNSYADVVARVSPAVVTVRSARRVRAPQQFPFMDDPIFREFFGLRQRRTPAEPPRVMAGLGSGVIVSKDGYCVTNHHVIDGAEEITLEFADRRTVAARLVGSDPPSDLAVLKIDARDLPTLTLGNSDKVRVGDIALAIGNPLGVGQTVTAGIISAKGRRTGLSDGSFENFLQTDAPINQGNSGGALISTAGELIGINSQILTPTGGNIGIGFAIPSNMARSVMDQLVKNGRVRRGQLGVGIQNITSDIASSMGLTDLHGVLVNAVAPGGPAEQAGIRRGDVIVKVDGSPVDDTNALRNMIASAGPGAQVTITVMRDGKQQDVRARLGEFRADTGEQRPRLRLLPQSYESPSPRLGLEVRPLTAELADRYGIPRTAPGLLVSRVDAFSAGGTRGYSRG